MPPGGWFAPRAEDAAARLIGLSTGTWRRWAERSSWSSNSADCRCNTADCEENRRHARIANGKDPDDLSDVYRGRPTRPKKVKPVDRPPNPYVPAPPLSLADAAVQLGVRPVQLAEAIREGKVATVRGRGGELLVAQDELERLRREGVEA